MPVYCWVAETKKGRKLKGELEANEERIALNQLKRRNLDVIKIKEKPKDIFENVAFMQPSIKKKDLAARKKQGLFLSEILKKDITFLFSSSSA